jgi:SecD/SecF fusion protein
MDRDLVETFKTSAVRKDDTFSRIVAEAERLQAENPVNAFGNLKDAVGTNDLQNYFPQFDVTAELNPTVAILNRVQKEAAGQIRLGIDLRGGTSFMMVMNTNKIENAEDLQTAIPQAIEVLRRRVDGLGVAEPVIQSAGGNRILVQLPGLSQDEKEMALRNLKKAAFLEFRLVHPQSQQMLEQGGLVPGYEVLNIESEQDGVKTLRPHLVKRRAERGLTGEYVSGANVGYGPLGQPNIQFELNSEGGSLFAEITRENVGRQLAIVLDGELYSAPVINEEILGGRGVISGDFNRQEAAELAQTLLNPLRAPLELEESREVDPSLGQDSIRSGIRAVLIGLITVSLFMLVYYLLAGLIANVALLLNMIFLLGALCLMDATLTLPGIAGVVLTIGMAVDANVLIFERIREELAAGKSMRGALTGGYDKAFSTIFDTNITTLISSIILWQLGTGPVKGFGVTLTLGIGVSMFTALFVTRLFFEFLYARGLMKSLPMLRILGNTKIDFLKYAMPAFILSWSLILVGNGFGIMKRGKEALSVDFVGGDSITLSFDQEVKERGELDVDKIRGTVDALGLGASQVQFQREIDTGRESLRVTVRSGSEARAGVSGNAETSQLVETTLQETFPAAQFEVRSVDKVGGSVTKQITQTAIIAALLAMFGILVYVAFRYEFTFAIGAVVAIIHDLLMTSGWYFLAGHEINVTTVAAFLTIIGFSINDTIVIFDRIREDLKLGVPGSFKDVMNTALNQTLSRTIITSGTTFLTAMALYIFGGGVINDFAFAFLIGIITGTYSSIYIACFIVLWRHKGARPNIGGSQVNIQGAQPVQA